MQVSLVKVLNFQPLGDLSVHNCNYRTPIMLCPPQKPDFWLRKGKKKEKKKTNLFRNGDVLPQWGKKINKYCRKSGFKDELPVMGEKKWGPRKERSTLHLAAAILCGGPKMAAVTWCCRHFVTSGPKMAPIGPKMPQIRCKPPQNRLKLPQSAPKHRGSALNSFQIAQG